MKLLKIGSINKKLALLIMLAVLPALAILFCSGIEQRRESIERAKRDVLLLTHAMSEAQKEVTLSTKQILSTLSLLPAIQTMDLQAASEIFKAVLAQNPNYNNIVLIDLNGEVAAAGRTFSGTNLADRKHVREALARRDFAVGEYIVSRVGTEVPAFPFAYPVLDKMGNPKAVLATVIKLTAFSRFHDPSTLPDKSFVAVTDHRGIRLFYYPAQEKTNPIGKQIKADVWEIAGKAQEPGILISAGSDGLRRILAFEQVRLTPEGAPYLHVWAGIPEAHILAPANAALTRNLLLMLLAAGISLFSSWILGKKTLISPIQSLLALTQKFAQGDLDARSELAAKTDEFETLTTAFHDMAYTLKMGQKTLRENEARFRLLMDSMNALVYVSDMDTYEILFINEYAKKNLAT